MYKLKCTHCGYLNEVNSEYLTFCSNCNRKLKNSFQEWKAVNPGKSFDAYKIEECVDEEILIAEDFKQKKRTKKWNTRLVIVLVIIGLFIGSIFTLFHFKKDDLLNNLVSLTNMSDDILDREWEKKAYYDLHFYLETPYKLDTISLPYPEQIKSLILSTAAYTIDKDAAAFSILLNYVEYLPEIPLSFEGAVQGSINSMENRPGVTDLLSSNSPYPLGGKEASMVTGSMKMYGIKFNFKMLIFAGEHQLSQVVVIFHENDENAEKAADRIFKSLKLL